MSIAITKNQFFCSCCKCEMVMKPNKLNNHFWFGCSSCGFEHFYPISGATNEEFYSIDSDYVDDLDLSINPRSLIQYNHKFTLNFLHGLGPNLKLLDIGCFNGFFVKILKNDKIDAYGIDFNKTAIDWGCKNYHLDGFISCSSIDSYVAEKKEFDVITLFEVLEHLEDPAEIIKSIKPLIKKGGFLAISTPNNSMCWRAPCDYPPHHISRFGRDSIVKLLDMNDFDLVILKEEFSIISLSRNFFGALFRSSRKSSLRGGEFKYRRFSLILRRFLNYSRPTLDFFAWPFDKILYLIGFRYLGITVIAKKR